VSKSYLASDAGSLMLMQHQMDLGCLSHNMLHKSAPWKEVHPFWAFKLLYNFHARK